MDSSSGGSSSSGTAFADGSTVTISSQALPNISAVMFCVAMQSTYYNNGVTYYTDCDESNDDSSITATMNLTTDNSGGSNTYRYVISYDTAFNNGWRLYKTGGYIGYGFTFVK